MSYDKEELLKRSKESHNRAVNASQKAVFIVSQDKEFVKKENVIAEINRRMENIKRKGWIWFPLYNDFKRKESLWE